MDNNMVEVDGWNRSTGTGSEKGTKSTIVFVPLGCDIATPYSGN